MAYVIKDVRVSSLDILISITNTNTGIIINHYFKGKVEEQIEAIIEYLQVNKIKNIDKLITCHIPMIVKNLEFIKLKVEST